MNICGIDPGLGGGIAFQTSKGQVMTFNMPRTNRDLWDFFEGLKHTYGKYIIFIERVQMWGSDTDGNNGKQFRIAKMLSNYNSMLALLEAQKLPIIEIAPRTWQKELGFVFAKDVTKQTRKNAYKRFAAKTYPSKKPTLKTADAICIMHYGKIMVRINPEGIKENIKNKETLTLFK